ncbi:MAG: hypothetical protein M3509_11225 [Chloroflexota bacterium]|nr:hypothetical protein [Chloroflexota bacterium]
MDAGVGDPGKSANGAPEIGRRRPCRAAGAARAGRCEPERSPCTGFEGCCSRSCDFRADGGTCSPCRGQGCASSNDCCGGETCQNNYCGGCRDRAVTCSGPSDCCFSDCDFHSGTRVCLSNFGGRCKRDVDCGNCYLRGNCDGACFNGQCLV